MKSIENRIRERVSYAKLKSYLDQNSEVTIEELCRLHSFLDTNMLYGSRRIAEAYRESLDQLVKDLKVGISVDVTITMGRVYRRTGVKMLSPQPYYVLAHRGYF